MERRLSCVYKYQELIQTEKDQKNENKTSNKNTNKEIVEEKNKDKLKT